MAELLVTIFSMLGAFALFMYGTKMIGDSIQKVAHKSISHFFDLVGDSRTMALLSGFWVTVLVQSSSDVITMVTSFVNSGLLPVIQALGVTLGANIGTTVTGWFYSLFAFDATLAHYSLAMMAVGFLFIYFSKQAYTNTLGEFIFGMGLLILGLNFLLGFIRQNPDALNFLSARADNGFNSVIFFTFFSAVSTIILRYSGLNMALIMTLVLSETIPLQMGMAMVLGANLGTAVRTSVSGLRVGSGAAKRVALWHVLFNCAGAIVWIIFFNKIADIFINVFSYKVSDIFLLAIYNTVFNLFTAVFFFPLMSLYEHVSGIIFKESTPGIGRSRYQLSYNTKVVADVPELSLAMAKKEIVNMTQLVEEMARDYMNVFNHPDEKMKKVVYGLKEKEELSDEMYIEITKFLIECSQNALLGEHHENVSFLSRIVKELESVADCISRLTTLCQRRYREHIHYRAEVQEELNDYFKLALSFLKSVKNKLAYKMEPEDFDQISYLENSINQERSRLRENAQHALESGDVNVKAEIMFMDHVRHIERIGDCCMNMAEAIRNLK